MKQFLSISLLFILLTFGASLRGQAEKGESFIGAHFFHNNLPIEFNYSFRVNGNEMEVSDQSIRANPANSIGVTFERRSANQYFYRVGLVDIGIGETTSMEVTFKRTLPGGVLIQEKGGQDITLHHLVTRFEYGKLFKTSLEKVTIAVSLMAQPYFSRLNFEPTGPLEFPASQSRVGMNVGALSRFAYHVNDRLALEFSPGVSFANVQYTSQFSDNPFIPVPNRTSSAFDADVDFSVNFTLGASWAL